MILKHHYCIVVTDDSSDCVENINFQSSHMKNLKYLFCLVFMNFTVKGLSLFNLSLVVTSFPVQFYAVTTDKSINIFLASMIFHKLCMSRIRFFAVTTKTCGNPISNCRCATSCKWNQVISMPSSTITFFKIAINQFLVTKETFSIWIVINVLHLGWGKISSWSHFDSSLRIKDRYFFQF